MPERSLSLVGRPGVSEARASSRSSSRRATSVTTSDPCSNACTARWPATPLRSSSSTTVPTTPRRSWKGSPADYASSSTRVRLIHRRLEDRGDGLAGAVVSGFPSRELGVRRRHGQRSPAPAGGAQRSALRRLHERRRARGRQSLRRWRGRGRSQQQLSAIHEPRRGLGRTRTLSTSTEVDQRPDERTVPRPPATCWIRTRSTRSASRSCSRSRFVAGPCRWPRFPTSSEPVHAGESKAGLEEGAALLAPSRSAPPVRLVGTHARRRGHRTHRPRREHLRSVAPHQWTRDGAHLRCPDGHAGLHRMELRCFRSPWCIAAGAAGPGGRASSDRRGQQPRAPHANTTALPARADDRSRLPVGQRAHPPAGLRAALPHRRPIS